MESSRKTVFVLVFLLLLGPTAFLGCDDDPAPDGDADADSDGDGDADADGDADGDGDGDADGDADGDTEGDGDVDPNQGATIEEPRNCVVDEPEPREYSATIRRTSYGIPHITGSDQGNVSYGLGYAMAEEYVCYIADQIVSVRSERAATFGPGDGDMHVEHDFGYKALRLYENAECAMAELSEEVIETLAGFAAGYNEYVESTDAADLPPGCTGAEWVRPVSVVDVLALQLHLTLLASGEEMLPMVANAQPPSQAADTQEADTPLPPPPNFRRRHRLGSNGWGIGSAMAENQQRGMLLANPHFPWESDLRFFESHLIVPNELDVYGVSLIGVPSILIGFNEHIAWTHTVADSRHLTVYNLTLEEGDPEHYMYDGQPRRMTKRDYTIQVRQQDGSMADQTRTMYRSHYGPMLVYGVLGWSTDTALSYRDANIETTQIIEHFYQVNRAQDLETFQSVQAHVHGIPWANTIYADMDGNAFYTDSCTVPYLSEEAINLWLEAIVNDPLTGMGWDLGFALLDGSRSVFEWQDHEDAVQPGTLPFSMAPQIERDDFVVNANDSHWLTHPDNPLEGYSPLYGPERTERTFRTRMNLILATETGADTSLGEDGLLSLDELENLAVGDIRGLLGELLRDQVVDRCDGQTEIDLDGTVVDISEACDVLEAWDLRYNTDSRGAFLWREFVVAWLGEAGEDAFEVAFDHLDPVNTPNTLGAAGDADPVLIGLATAVELIEDTGLDIDAALGDVQFVRKDDETIGVPGGQWLDGTIAIAVYTTGGNFTLLPLSSPGDVVNDRTGLSDEGYVVNYGNSFVMALEFLEDGPQARAILTYSQSPNPQSPHYTDQTELYNEQQLRPVLFHEADIIADNPETIELSTAD